MILHCPSFPFDALHSDLMNYQPYYQATEMLMNNDGLSMHVYEAIKPIYNYIVIINFKSDMVGNIWEKHKR